VLAARTNLRPSAAAAWAWVWPAAHSWCTAWRRPVMMVSRSAGVPGFGGPWFALLLARAGVRPPADAVLVAGDGLAGMLAQVVPEVPPAGDLVRVRGGL